MARRLSGSGSGSGWFVDLWIIGLCLLAEARTVLQEVCWWANKSFVHCRRQPVFNAFFSVTHASRFLEVGLVGGFGRKRGDRIIIIM